MKRILVFLFVCIASYVSFSQNLVPNPSFEEYDSCPQFLDDFFVKDWYSPSFGTPDYFNSCSSQLMSVPQNQLGMQHAYHGNGYAGFILGDFSGNNVREYLQVELKKVLAKDVNYLLKVYISRADSSNLACDNFGMLFTENAIYQNNWNEIQVSPQITFNSGIVSNDSGWVELLDTIIGTGFERFLTFGVFTDDQNTSWVEVRDSGYFNTPYYYIDMVEVSPLVSCQSKLNLQYPNVFTPNNDGKNDFWYPNGDLSGLAALYIINRWGNEVAYLTGENSFSWDGKSKNNEVISTGVYYIIEEKKNCPLKNAGTIHLIK